MTGVVYFDADGKQQRQKARVVCVAGNSIESPRLLLNSASRKFPDGLANSSGQVGRNYMRHTTGSVYAIFDQPVHMYRGTTMAGIIRDEAQTTRAAASSAATSWRPSRSACRSWRPSSTRAPGAASSPAAMDDYAHMAGMWIVGEDMPQETNRVTLHATRRTNAACRSRTCISTTIRTTSRCATMPSGRAKRSTRRPARRASSHAALSVDAQSRHLPDERQRRATACEQCYGQTHDIANLFISDGSQFTTGGAENPTLTIVTLAIRQADYIANQMKSNTI